MNYLKLKILAGLCLWIISIQGLEAFTIIPEFIELEINNPHEYRKTSAPSIVYINQFHIFLVESAPHVKAPLLSFPIHSFSSLTFERRQVTSKIADFGMRDLRFGIKKLFFPFHCFW